MRASPSPFLLLIMLAAAPAVAAPSLCAALPTAGKVAQPGPAERVPALRLPDRRLACAPGFALDTTARPPSCRRPGQRAVDGDPRAACRASLALGPIAEVPAQWRPTRSCASGPIRSILRLEGVNAGLAEVTLTALSPGITVTTLDDDSKDLPPEQRPAALGCFGHACRLVALEVAADATDPARLELAIKDGETLVVPVPLTTHCPQ
jgi:hypothetical protein